MTRTVRTNRLAIISFVSGLLALLCIAGIGAVFRLAPTNDNLIATLVDGILIPARNLSVLVALVTGILALRQIRRKEGAAKGKTLAWLGIAISIGWIVFFILVVLAFFLLLFASRVPEGSNGLTPILSLAIIPISVFRKPPTGFPPCLTHHQPCHAVRWGAPGSR
jgi:signal transduction histidine kinase